MKKINRLSGLKIKVNFLHAFCIKVHYMNVHHLLNRPLFHDKKAETKKLLSIFVSVRSMCFCNKFPISRLCYAVSYHFTRSCCILWIPSVIMIPLRSTITHLSISSHFSPYSLYICLYFMSWISVTWKLFTWLCVFSVKTQHIKLNTQTLLNITA